MREANADLWAVQAQARCITTNGSIRKDGRAVMGRGCALQAKARYPGVDRYLGMELARVGNHVTVLMDAGQWLLLSFPVKHVWSEPADHSLVERSARELVALADTEGWKRVVLPRPGCGNGQLRWEQVKPLLEGLLDDRFLVVDFTSKVAGAQRASETEAKHG